MKSSLFRLFSSDKTVPSPLLNRLGAQVGRTLLAQGMTVVRRRRIGKQPLNGEARFERHCRELLDHGFTAWSGFLEQSLFERVVNESKSLDEMVAQYPHTFLKNTLNHGPNRLYLTSISKECFEHVPAIETFYQDRRLLQLMSVAEGRMMDLSKGHRAYERLIQGSNYDEVDPETELHSDIFFNTHKAWLYLEDVELEHGPLVFVKLSHIPTIAQIRHIFRESCGANRGSRRIAPEELQDVNLSETVLAVPRNTLVIANTFGYHRRLRGRSGTERHALHWSVRANPFTF